MPTSGGETTPQPKDGEVVIFRDFFTAGLRLPVDPIVPLLLAPFNAKLHHLTPNAMVQLSKIIWAVWFLLIVFVGCMSFPARAERSSRKGRWNPARL